MTASSCGPARDLQPAEFARRTAVLRAQLAHDRLDAALLVTEVSRYYYTGL